MEYKETAPRDLMGLGKEFLLRHGRKIALVTGASLVITGGLKALDEEINRGFASVSSGVYEIMDDSAKASARQAAADHHEQRRNDGFVLLSSGIGVFTTAILVGRNKNQPKLPS